MTIEDFKRKKVGFISLGCDKNRVDLERIIFSLKSAGLEIVNDPADANIIIVNTCSFLEASRLEAIENIVDIATYKTIGKLEKLIVTGCLNELNYADLGEALPEVDAFIRIKDNSNIVNLIAKLYDIDLNESLVNGRVLTTPNHYAYIKISEGCNNFCSYCLIPYIRGRFTSSTMEDILKEANDLAERGVKELILVAQDVTKYGVDIYGEKRLVQLIQQLSKIEKLEWIRLLYCYPEQIDDDLIKEIKTNRKVLKYMDIPLQHVSTNILKSMNRRSSKESIYELFEKLQSEIPEIVIRTTFIVGFPGESPGDVNDIKEFLEKFKLNNVGFFTYSREEGTKSYNFDNQIDEDTKKERLDYLAQIQFDILNKVQENMLGKICDVIIDYSDDNYSYGRYYGQAPLIDSNIFIDKPLNVGEIYKIKITEKLDYDFKGEIYEYSK